MKYGFERDELLLALVCRRRPLPAHRRSGWTDARLPIHECDRRLVADRAVGPLLVKFKLL